MTDAPSTSATRPPPQSARIGGLAPHRWLALALFALGIALTFGAGEWWARALMLAHYGAFLLWQPIFRGEARLGLGSTTVVVGIAVLIALASGWWVIGLWLAVLIALVGGNSAGAAGRWTRLAYVLAVVHLASLLLLWVVPHLFDPAFHDIWATWAARYGLAVLPAAILLLPSEGRDAAGGSAMDLFYALLLFLLTLVVVLGCLVLVVAGGEDYAVALIKTTLALSAALLAVSWLWNPRVGFAGVGQLLSRYLLTVGLPFERWMGSLAALAESESDPNTFLRRALHELVELPWLAGARWEGVRDHGEFGVVTPHAAQYSFHGLTMVWYGRRTMSATLIVHVRLITQLLGWFYAAKRREQTLSQNAYTQAIYETGARLTHDVKNLLQSMKTLVAAAEGARVEEAAAFTALMQRQLPQVTQRLAATLDKLKRPQAADGRTVAAADWWIQAQRRYEREGIEWGREPLDGSRPVPMDLLDSVLDNLVTNALRKRHGEPDTAIRVFLDCDDKVALSVCDSGAMVDPDVARHLFDAPVSSQAGLGIGLYQAAKQAAGQGWRLSLAVNREREVCFRLEEGG